MNDNTNPHQVFDGAWGGFSVPRWFHAGSVGFGPRDVLERHTDQRTWPSDPKPTDWKWVRIWDDAAGRWRDLTDEDRAKLKDFDANR